MENLGHFRSKMVDVGLLACLEKQLPLKIALIGGYHEKELVEMNNMGTQYYLLCTLALSLLSHRINRLAQSNTTTPRKTEIENLAS
jgi:hypothetical protein